MAKKVGVISINLTAGTAQFISDLDKANAKITDFTNRGKAGFEQLGAHSVSSMQATSGSLKLLEGHFENNLRASERFIATTLGLGPVLQAAFPLIGGLAFGGMLVSIGEKVAEFMKKMEQAPERIGGAFRELNAPIRSSNDALQVAIDKIQTEIDKLEGKHTNTLALTLDEAKVAADKLADALDRDLDKITKVLKEQNIGFFAGLASGQSTTTDVQKYFGGETGQGGFRGRVNAITEQANSDIGAARDLGKQKMPGFDAAAKEKEIRDKANIEIAKEYAEALRFVNAELAKTNQLMVGGAYTLKPSQADNSRREILQGLVAPLRNQSLTPGLLAEEQDLTSKRNKLQSNEGNAKMDRPFEDRIKAMKAQLQELQAKLASVGQTDAFKALTEGHANAIKVIEEVNKALERYHTALNPKQKAEIDALAVTSKQTEVETAYKTKLDSTNRSIDDRIAAAKALAAAMGKGYEATKAASVETQLMSAMGREYNDPARKTDQDALRGKLASEYDAKHGQEIAATNFKLEQQVELEKTLAAVQAQGAEAVRIVTLAYKLRQMTAEGASREQIALEIQLYNAQRANIDAAGIAELDRKVLATQKLAAAQMQSAEAQRKAGLENKYSEMAAKGESPEAIGRTRQIDDLDHQMKVTEEALKTSQAYRNSIDSLQQQLLAITDLEKAQGATRDLEIDRKRIEDEIRDTLVKQSLAMGTLEDGLKAFFTDANREAEQPGKILYDGLHHAVDSLSSELAKLMTGQKTNWAKMLQGIGESMAQQSTKALLNKGIGALGGKLGLDLDGKKQKAEAASIAKGNRLGALLGAGKLRYDGQSPSNAIYVQLVSNESGTPGAANQPAAFGGSTQNGMVSAFPNFGPSPAPVASGSSFTDLLMSGGMQAASALGRRGPGIGATLLNDLARPAGALAGLLLLRKKRKQPSADDAIPSAPPSDDPWPERPTLMRGSGGASPDDTSGIIGAAAGGAAAGAVAGMGSSAGEAAAAGTTESVSSDIAFGAEAAGFAFGTEATPVDSAFWVGEHGPELMRTSTPHSVTPLDKLAGRSSGDIHIHMGAIDARGADLGAAGRLLQVQETYKKQAISAAAHIQNEQARRTPQR